MAYIRRRTRDGEELARFALRVLRDERARVSDRMAAATWLADRGFGKPRQPLGPDAPDGLSVSMLAAFGAALHVLSADELDTLGALLDRLTAVKPARTVPRLPE